MTQALTPCFAGPNVLTTLEPNDQCNQTRVVVHARAEPCGHVTEAYIPTYREAVEIAFAHREAVAVKPCQWCGDSL